MMHRPVPHSPLTQHLLISHPMDEAVGESVAVIKALIQKREEWEAHHAQWPVGLHQTPALAVGKVSGLAHLAASRLSSLGTTRHYPLSSVVTSTVGARECTFLGSCTVF